MVKIPKLKKGDRVAIVSPSFAAPAVWPHVHELGLKRIREVFGLEPVEYPVGNREIGNRDRDNKTLKIVF
jgi:muramoyltetrapeptide carboxypeptidase LdcA involved in peptidoglycan recycling